MSFIAERLPLDKTLFRSPFFHFAQSYSAMRALSPPRLRSLCNRLLRARYGTAHQEIAFWHPIVESVLERNIANDRFERFTKGVGKRSVGLEQYVDLVIRYVSQEYPRVKRLEMRDQAEWQRLGQFLESRAEAFLQSFNPFGDRQEEARDFAQRAAMIIFDHPYPYDVSFDAWATRILKNLILSHYTRSSDPLHRTRQLASIDDAPTRADDHALPLAESLPDERATRAFNRVEDRALLFQALARLTSPEQRAVITLEFFGEVTDAEIARRLGKSKQAVYNLRNRALARLNELLQTAERNALREASKRQGSKPKHRRRGKP